MVRSTLPKAEAALSALVRTRLHGAVREPVTGEAVTGDARSAAATSRGDARCRRSRPGRARRGGRGGGEDDAVERCTERGGAATAVSAASRRASGARSERSERRREGYPPEGPRPRSGLGREARSRSDAPRLTVPSGTPVSIFGTNSGIIVFTRIRTADGIVITGTLGAGADIVVIVACHDARLMAGRA